MQLQPGDDFYTPERQSIMDRLKALGDELQPALPSVSAILYSVCAVMAIGREDQLAAGLTSALALIRLHIHRERAAREN